MALFYKYFFKDPHINDSDVPAEYCIYAASEKLARKKFRKETGKEAGPLLRRERW